MPPKSLNEMVSSRRPNLVLLTACGALAIICLFLYMDRTNDDGITSVGRRLWGPGSEQILVGRRKSVGTQERRPECLDTLKPGKGCLADSRVWAVNMGYYMEKALTAVTIHDDKGNRLYCEDLTGTQADAPLITVKQGQAYPKGYSSIVPKGKFLDGGYPIRLRVGSTDALVMKQFFCEPHFHYISYLGPWLPKNRPATIVDAGANIGLASILFAQFANFNSEILAIEANPSTLEILEENVAVLGDGIKTVGAALAPQHLAGSSVNFVGRKDQYWGFRVLPDDQLKPDMLVHKVPTKSLNDIKKMSKSGKIDFMKIDIEGYEKEIFPDVASWPVMCEMRCIAAEIHDWFEPGCSDALNKFLQNGCRNDPFRHIANTGEYSVYCRMGVLAEDEW